MLTDFDALESAIDPSNRISFLLDWELTMKCNLDCSYCSSGLYNGHDNSIAHPLIDDCLKTVDFMFRYVDIYMSTKSNGIRYVVLNIYGGESLHHPDIVKILEKCVRVYQELYKDRWHLTVTTTTNAIVSEKKLAQILPYIDEFTCSYHTENTEKNKQLFRDNLLRIKQSGKRLKVIVLMHPEDDLWKESQNLTQWCDENNIKYLNRQLDHAPSATQFNYNEKQVTWFDSFYQKKSYKTESSVTVKQVGTNYDLSDSGRACCGGRQVCKDQNQKNRHFFVENKFPDWYCSVNEFFVYIKQVTGEVFVNKDCKMNFEGQVGPIGNLTNAEILLDQTQAMLHSDIKPVIQCKKSRCLCGLCAPKSKDLETFNSIMRKYRT